MSSAPVVEGQAVQVQDRAVRIKLADAPKLTEVGGSAMLKHSGLPEPIVVARRGDKEFVAVSARCTHMGMPIGYRHAEGDFQCGSFGHSTFRLDGAVVKGPAKKPLKSYPVTLEGDELRISLGSA